jgi:hypothetical protein
MALKERKPFGLWVSSTPDVNFPRTKNNKQDEFEIQLPSPCRLAGTWSVRMLSFLASEVKRDAKQPRGELMIYSDLIRYVLVGHDYFPLLDWIPTTGSTGARYQEANHPIVHRVNHSYLETIGFKIADVKGQPPVWLSKQETLIYLSFEPEDDHFQENTMDQTFLSNQSKPYYPTNKPSKFTAKLPALQRLGTGWKVGISKMTIPSGFTLTRAYKWNLMMATKDPKARSPTNVFVMDKVKSMADLCRQFNAGVQASFWKWHDRGNGDGGVGGATVKERSVHIVNVSNGSSGTIGLNHAWHKYPRYRSAQPSIAAILDEYLFGRLGPN